MLTRSFVAFAVTLAAAAPAGAATLVVKNTNDDGTDSLRQALKTAGDGDLVVFKLGAFAHITLSSGKLTIASSVTIAAPDRSITIDGGGVSGVFVVNTGVTATLSGLNVTGAGAEPAILNNGNLTLSGCYLHDNTANGPTGGAVQSKDGSLVVESCEFDNNDANGVSGGGGAINVVNLAPTSNVLITHSSFIGNKAAATGGAIEIGHAGSTVQVVDCTFAGNQAPSGSAIHILAATGDNQAIVASATFNSNPATTGAAIDASGTGRALVLLRNTVLSGAPTPQLGAGLTVVSYGNNILADTSATLTGPRDANNVFPGGPVQDNLFPLGLSFQPGSPVIDGGDCTDLAGVEEGVTTDQAGRPRIVGAACDIGASESGQYPVLIAAAAEAAGAHCAAGGIAIKTGSDNGAGGGTPGNGILEAGEVTSTVYVCNGQNGQNGSNGQNGANGTNGTNGSLIKASVEAAGAHCGSGGARLDLGLDDGDGGGTAGDGILQPGEIDSTQYVCNGANGALAGAASLIKISPEPAGVNCSAGGQRIDVGLDNGDGGGIAGDGILQAGEADQTTWLCNAAPGKDGKDGKDGSNGADGAPGQDGAAALVSVSAEPAGTHCANGGERIETGLDDGNKGGTAADGVLQLGEIRQTSYVCNGAAAKASGCSTAPGAPSAPPLVLMFLLAVAALRRRAV